MGLLPSAASLYRFLLLAYPAEFRNEYGTQMEDLFVSRLRVEPRAGVWLETIVDLLSTASREHASILWNDLRYAGRTFAKSPGFTATALLTIALGIGATTAVFSVMNAVLLKSLPYFEPERLAYFRIPLPNFKMPAGVELGPSTAEFYDLKKGNHSFSRVAMFSSSAFNVGDSGGTIKVGGVRVTAGFFETLGVTPEMGRTIDGNDDRPGNEHAAVIGYSLWQRQFGGKREAVGKAIRLNRQSFRIIGVMPPGFAYPQEFEDRSDSDSRPAEVWIPAAFTPKDRQDRNNLWGDVIGRLRPGVTLQQVQAEMTMLTVRFTRLREPFFQNGHASVRPFLDEALGEVRPLIWLLMIAVFVVLLIACSNVANLLLARASGRAGEMGLRSALGADRQRLVRQVLTEALALSVCGGILGILFAFAALEMLLHLHPSSIPRLDEIAINGAVLSFTLGISLLTGILFGSYPAVSLSRATLIDLLKRSGNKGVTGSSSRVRNVLIVVEVSLAVVLLTGAGLLIRSFLKIEGISAGFTGAALTGKIELDDRYNDEARRREFFRNMMNGLGAIHGVRSAGLISHLPLSGTGSISTFDVGGYTNEKDQVVDNTSATGAYFQAMHIDLLRGRAFNDADVPEHPAVVVVSEAFTRKYFHGRNPLGGRVYFSRGTGAQPYSTIVGVVRDVRSFSLEESPAPLVYRSFWQSPGQNAFFAIETDAPPEQIATSVKRILRSTDHEINLTDFQMMSKRRLKLEDSRRYQAMLLTVFSVTALVLSLVGLYALISYSVRLRGPELAVRIAVGASSGQIKAMVMKQGLGLTAAGLAVGLAAAAGLTRFLSSMLFETGVLDPETFVLVPLLFLIVAAAACWIPARHAASTSPSQVFRAQ